MRNYQKRFMACMERKHIRSGCYFIKFKYNRLNYKCKECRKRCFKMINGLIKKFPKVYQISKDDLNEFVLLLRKGF